MNPQVTGLGVRIELVNVGEKGVAISQSSYIPWKGYFDMINSVDCFVLFDDVQYTRRDWRNRNIVKTAHGAKWLTVPVAVKGNFFQPIREVRVSNAKWAKEHLSTLRHTYGRARYFGMFKDWLDELYNAAAELEYLSDINRLFITQICQSLQISTPLRSSAEFTLACGKSERLLGICQQLNASTYVSGPAAKAYLDETLFQKSGVGVIWYSYQGYPEYEQLYPPFSHQVSILDLLMHTGPHARDYMLSFNSDRQARTSRILHT
jgi:hypothetical protein